MQGSQARVGGGVKRIVSRLGCEESARVAARISAQEARRTVQRYAFAGIIVVETSRKPIQDPARTSIPKRGRP
jgi:hypothetical protein